ncbi:MAG: adenylate/guanylate cyclase domain-containing protein [Kiloniellales bacterium]|nr:adenylate/guanylate cyclase domain-containing protein [Kiloniellales bacterium]
MAVSQNYVSPSRTRGLLEGERKFATVLFADIVNSSALVADADPEEANEKLLPWLQAMVEAIDGYGGTVTQLLGDGVMALFGAPAAQEHHAIRACLAAQEIQLRCARTDEAGGVPLPVRLRVGISSGIIVTQPIRSGMLTEYRAVGDTVHLAARAEEAARPGEVLLTEETYRLVAGQVRVEPASYIRLSQASRSVRTYALQGVTITKRSMRPLESPGKPSFVGRTQDLTALSESLSRASEGHGEVFVVTGDPGVGKSRLMLEFLGTIDTGVARALKVDLEPTGVPRFDDPVARLVRSLLELEAASEPEVLAAAIAERLKSLNVGGTHAVSAILEVLGQSANDPGWETLDPPERLRVTLVTIADATRALGRKSPLVIVLEDFHWASAEVQQLGKEIAVRLDGTRVQLVLTSRTHHERPWTSWPKFAEHRIRALPSEDAARFVGSLLGNSEELGALVPKLIEKTQGNPFFIEECVRSLVERGALNGTPGGYRLVVPLDDIEIPVTVHGVLAERIDSLPRVDRQTLLCAAVIGRNFDVALLEQLLAPDDGRLADRLARLEQQGFLQRTRIVPNLEYGFRHTLTHEVAYGTLLKRDRLRLHTTVMKVLRRRPGHELPIKIELLAHHAYRAQAWAYAAAYSRRAASKAQSASRNGAAQALFTKALDAQSQMPQTERNGRRGIDIRLELAQSLFTLGRSEAVRSVLKAAETAAKALHDERRLGRICSARMLCHWVDGDLSNAIEMGRQGLEIARRLNDPQLEIQVASRLGCMLIDRGDYADARKLLEGIIPRVSEGSSHKQFGTLAAVAVGCRADLARSLGELGQFSAALKIGDEALRIADDNGHSFSQIYACLSVGTALLRKGDFARSIPLLERAHRFCMATQIKLLLPLSEASLGYALVRTGSVAQGLGYLKHAVELANKDVVLGQLSQQTVWLAEALLRAGQPEQALAHATTALDIARKNGEKGDEAWAQWALGEVYRCDSSAKPRKAAAAFNRARTLAEGCNMIPLVSHCTLALGKLQLERTACEKGRERAEEALQLYQSLDMGFYALEAKEAMVSVSTPVA